MSEFDTYVEDSLFFSDDNLFVLGFSDIVDESVSFSPSCLEQAIFSDFLTSLISFIDPVLSPVDIYDCIAVNTKDFFLSVYSGFDYNSFTVFEDVVYAANENGVFVLDSDTDNGATINTGIILPVTTFASLSDKRVRMCFTDCQGAQPTLRLSTYSAERDLTVSDQIISKSKAYFPRTLRGKEWEIRIAGFDSILLMEFFLTVLTR